MGGVLVSMHAFSAISIFQFAILNLDNFFVISFKQCFRPSGEIQIPDLFLSKTESQTLMSLSCECVARARRELA